MNKETYDSIHRKNILSSSSKIMEKEWQHVLPKESCDIDHVMLNNIMFFYFFAAGCVSRSGCKSLHQRSKPQHRQDSSASIWRQRHRRQRRQTHSVEETQLRRSLEARERCDAFLGQPFYRKLHLHRPRLIELAAYSGMTWH